MAGIAPAFVVEEEEQAVLDDRASDGTSEYVAVQLLTTDAVRIIEERIRRKICIAVVLVKRSVKFVSAALGDQRHLCARSAAYIRASVCSCSAKLLNRVECHAQNRREG